MGPGVLTCCNAGPNTNTSAFMITTVEVRTFSEQLLGARSWLSIDTTRRRGGLRSKHRLGSTSIALLSVALDSLRYHQAPWLNGHCVVFGCLADAASFEALDKMEACGTEGGRPSVDIQVRLSALSESWLREKNSSHPKSSHVMLGSGANVCKSLLSGKPLYL